MKRLSDLFDVSYGNKLDLNKMRLCPIANGGVHFVGRSSENRGISASVAPVNNVKPYDAGLITVALGGTKLLSSFVQETPFYTAQNVAVLKPKAQIGFGAKLFTCLCIRHNRFRYSAFGREANRSLKDLLVPEPSEFPAWARMPFAVIETLSTPKVNGDSPASLNPAAWKSFELGELFEIERGRGPRKKELSGNGKTPFITSTDSNNGVTGMTTMTPCHQGNTIGVNRNGSVGEAFYQPKAFCSTEDVHIFTPKFQMNHFTALFLTTLIRRERFRYGYGRKWGIERMKESMVKLPTKNDGTPDWGYMEQYVMSLPFSGQL